MTQVSIAEIVARWNDPASRPLFKGKLIDDQGCMCAQGDILHTYCGWAEMRLQNADQHEADTAIMTALGISRAHAILLRTVNDQADGAPGVVLTNPDKVIGDQAPRVLAFWRHLDGMTLKQRQAAGKAAGQAAWYTVEQAVGYAVEQATFEIMGASKLDKFVFLPPFGFATPADLDALIPTGEA